MFNISDYLKKFARIEGDSLEQKGVIQAALKEVCGIDGASFDIKKGVVLLKGSPVMKSAIFMRKTLLLETIKARLPRARIIDIK